MVVEFKGTVKVWDDELPSQYRFYFFNEREIKVFDRIAGHYVPLPDSMSVGSRRRLLGLARKAKREKEKELIHKQNLMRGNANNDK